MVSPNSCGALGYRALRRRPPTAPRPCHPRAHGDSAVRHHRLSPPVALRRRAARRRADPIGRGPLVHIGLNLVFLVPDETGGMEIYARQLIPELVAAAPGVRFTAFVNREAASEPGAPWGELI